MRFSPARAGNRQAGRLCPLPAAVQPRACGEQSRRVPTFVGGHGSAPRVRGTAPVARRSCRRRRFSPARAGNRSRGKTRAITRPVQPRACGEQRGGEFRDYWKCGSAPRVRGTGSTGQCQTRRQRFSPARAGNSRAHPHLGTRRAVQPRACGEQPTKAAPSSSANGSAPRVRGTGRSVHVRMGWRRFSPARAGNRPTCMTLISRAFHDVKERTKMNNSFISLLLPRMSQRLCLWRARRNSRFVGGWRRKTHERKAIEIDWLASIDAYGLKFETAVGR